MSKILAVWVTNYVSPWKALPKARQSPNKFADLIDATTKTRLGDVNARDQDFEQASTGTPGTGSDSVSPAGADTNDLVYFAGHGTSTGPRFSVTSSDDAQAKNSEVSWGQGSLKWIVFDACDILMGTRVPVIDRWGPSFQGLHTILGFRTKCNEETTRGTRFASYLKAGDTIIEAWKKAVEESESSAGWAYLRSYSTAANMNTYSDHWIGHGSVSNRPSPGQPLRYGYRTFGFSLSAGDL